jgi:hypothetical protein
MMPDGLLFRHGRLGRSDIHISVYLPGIGGDDFSAQSLRQRHPDVCFSNTGGTDES